MNTVELMRVLENAWEHAYPGREAAERDALLCALWRRLQQADDFNRCYRPPSAS
jgi:hypothetical protein